MSTKMENLCIVVLFLIVDNFAVTNSFHLHHAPNERIVGGKPVRPHSVPFIVAITAYDAVNDVPSRCGGSLISDRHILTAAHCFRNGKKITLLQFGIHNRWDTSDPDQITRTTATYVIHSGYSSTVYSRDIALITLQDPINLSSENIKTIALPDNQEATKTSYVGKTVQTYGWGWTSDDPVEYPMELMGINLTVIDQQSCFSKLQKARVPYPTYLYDYELCTNGEDDEGSSIAPCRGDSGGPLVFNGTLIGVVSRGGTGNCHNQEPTVFENVGTYLPWIKQQIRAG